jgi:hypothetical protein
MSNKKGTSTGTSTRIKFEVCQYSGLRSTLNQYTTSQLIQVCAYMYIPVKGSSTRYYDSTTGSSKYVHGQQTKAYP